MPTPDYTKHADESIDQYNERVKQYYTPAPTKYVLNPDGTSYSVAVEAQVALEHEVKLE